MNKIYLLMLIFWSSFRSPDSSCEPIGPAFLQQFKVELAQMVTLNEFKLDQLPDAELLIAQSLKTGDAYYVLKFVKPQEQQERAETYTPETQEQARYYYFIEPKFLQDNGVDLYGYEGDGKFDMLQMPENLLVPGHGDPQGFPLWGEVDEKDFFTYQGDKLVLNNGKRLISISLLRGGRVQQQPFAEREIPVHEKEELGKIISQLKAKFPAHVPMGLTAALNEIRKQVEFFERRRKNEKTLGEKSENAGIVVRSNEYIARVKKNGFVELFSAEDDEWVRTLPKEYVARPIALAFSKTSLVVDLDDGQRLAFPLANLSSRAAAPRQLKVISTCASELD